MKYCVVIIDGASGHPLPQRGGKTSLELAKTPNLDALAREGQVGLTCNVPEGMEPSSAVACMSILGYDPRLYYRGRSAIEAGSMGISIGEDEVVFRCNLVTVSDGKMKDYSAGHITSEEAGQIIHSLDKELGSDIVKFYPGVSYRHIIKLKSHTEAIEAVCTPPHDISGKSIEEYLPKGQGSAVLLDLMHRSENILKAHPVNRSRVARGELPATTVWLFWPSGQVSPLPPFQKTYGVRAGMISGVDLLRGLAQMAKMDIMNVPGVTDGLDNNYAAQGEAALQMLKNFGMAVVHIEAPDEAGHSGAIDHKIEAIERTDKEIISRLRTYKEEPLRLFILPDHPTPIEILTHTGESVPFLLWGPGFTPNGTKRLTEAEARASGFLIPDGYAIINKLIKT